MGETVIDGMKFEDSNLKAVEAAFDAKPVVKRVRSVKPVRKAKNASMSLRSAQWAVVKSQGVVLGRFAKQYQHEIVCVVLALGVGLMLGVKI